MASYLRGMSSPARVTFVSHRSRNPTPPDTTPRQLNATGCHRMQACATVPTGLGVKRSQVRILSAREAPSTCDVGLHLLVTCDQSRSGTTTGVI